MQPAFGAQKQLNAMSWAKETLAREPEQRWLRINWAQSPQAAAEMARRTGKPIFVELVVGRYGRDTSQVC